jgi:hypothetical protein
VTAGRLVAPLPAAVGAAGVTACAVIALIPALGL